MQAEQADKPYRIRVVMRRTGHNWIKGFDTATAAAEYWYKAAFKIGDCDVTGTAPSGDSRQWVTRRQLQNIARKESQ